MVLKTGKLKNLNVHKIIKIYNIVKKQTQKEFT